MLAYIEPDFDAESVADEHVHDPLVPPAFGEVGHHVNERQFDQFPGDGKHPQKNSVSKEERFEEPSEEMSQDKYICFFPQVFQTQ